MCLFPSPPCPQEPIIENEVFLFTSVCCLLVVSTEMDKLHHFSAIIYQAFWNTQKPAQEPGESWGRLTQGILQEVGLHLGICKGKEEDWKERNPEDLFMLIVEVFLFVWWVFWGVICFFVWEGKGRQIQMGTFC